MPNVSPFSALNTAFSGLQAAQAALNITSKNIASVGVDGYSRQRIHQEAQPGSTVMGSLPPVSGVQISSYERIRDVLMDRRLYDQLPRESEAETRADLLSQVELAFAEPGENGLQNLMNRFWSSWQAAASSPASEPSRQAVIERARSMIDGFDQVSTQLQTVISQITDEQTQRLSEINQIAQDIAQLSEDIQMAVSYGGGAGDLQDQRDVLLDKLAAFGNITVTHYDTGLADVQFGSFALITGPTAATATLANLNTASSGRMFALEDLRVNVIPGLQSQLDAIASGIISEVNTLHQTGFDLNGAAGGVVFTGTSAATIALDSTWASSPRNLALSNSAAAPGDNSIGIQISNLASKPSVVGTQTISGAYGSLIAGVGSITAKARSDQQVQGVLADSVRDKRSGVSGVSLDEEMSNLIRYQQSYAAAARAISAIDQMLEILVSRTGKVGM